MNRIYRFARTAVARLVLSGLLALLCLSGAFPSGGMSGSGVAHAADGLVSEGNSLQLSLEAIPSVVRTVCSAGPPACDFNTIQEAVDISGAGDLIKVAAGTYTDIHARPVPFGYFGPAMITQVVYLSKTLTIRGGYTTTNGFADPPDPEANPTTLDAQGQGRVLFIAGVVSPTVEGLRITGGDATGLGGHTLATQAGGGVFIIDAPATISNSWVFSNTAGQGGDGGGVFLHRSGTTLRGNIIAANSAGKNGGGLNLYQSAFTLVSNIISANTAITWGGGLYMATCPATLAGNTIISNSAGFGAGLSMDGCDGAILSSNTVVSNTAIAAGGMYLGYTGYVTPAMIVSNTFSFNKTSGPGGGAYLIYSPNHFTDNRFANNTASGGAGLYSFSGEALFVQNTFSANTAEGYGGGLLLYHDLSTFAGNTFSDNIAQFGGGLYLNNSPMVVVNGSVITANTAISIGGGLYLYQSAATLVTNTISANTAMWGGGVFLGESPAAISGNTVSGNSAQYGGGLRLTADSNAVLINNVVADNVAGGLGSGLYVDNSSPLLLHTTIAGNTGGDGSGLYLIRNSSAILSNTILVDHAIGVTGTANTSAELEATLWGNGIDWGGAGTISTGTVNLWGDPAFVDPAGGDYHIGPGSAALDSGVDAAVAVDLDGDSRPIGPGYDIGADEFPAALSLTKQAPSDLVPAGSPLTYTLQVTNTGLVPLSTTIADFLPAQVSPTGVLSWTALITPGGIWAEEVMVVVVPGYAGPLTNVVQASTEAGVTAAYTHVVTVEEAITGLVAVNDSPTLLGDLTTLTATVTAGSNVSYTWAFGDGVFGNGAVVSYTYSAVGVYTAVVTASNSLSTLTTTTPVTIRTAAATYYVYLPLILRY